MKLPDRKKTDERQIGLVGLSKVLKRSLKLQKQYRFATVVEIPTTAMQKFLPSGLYTFWKSW